MGKEKNRNNHTVRYSNKQQPKSHPYIYISPVGDTMKTKKPKTKIKRVKITIHMRKKKYSLKTQSAVDRPQE